jgi:hypothetical protein
MVRYDCIEKIDLPLPLPSAISRQDKYKIILIPAA